MNTILITGTAKCNSINKVEYDVTIWASRDGEQIQYIRPIDKVLDNYSQLWDVAKDSVTKYFEEPLFKDGAYTRFLDHLITQ